LETIFTGQSVAIAGFGIEGQAAYQFLQSIDDCQVIIIDQNTEVELPSGAASKLGSDWLVDIDSYDIVLRTSGMQPAKLAGARQVRTSTDLLFEIYGPQTIGVTGTKGKSTTASLIAAVLESAGQQGELVGNIGRSTWEILGSDITPETVVVAELSSFQLADVSHSPHGAVLLPIASDHLDWHHSQQNYEQSKLNLIRYQTSSDYLVTTKATSTELSIADITTTNIILYDEIVIQDNPKIIINDNEIAASDIALPGQHNLSNISLALIAAQQWLKDHGDSVSNHWDSVRRTICEFEPLPYHLQDLGQLGGYRIINDSYSSTPIATSAALLAVEGSKTLIFGGQSRGLDLASTIANFDEADVRAVVIVGADASYCQKVADTVARSSHARPVIIGEQDMDTILHTALAESAERTTILFSPGHPSFDMYTNFNQRGELFTNAVEQARSEYA